MFKTKDDTHVYIVGALQHGIFKHCVHLTLDVTGQFRSRPWEPYCAKHNFVRSDRNQFHYCCPDTCCSFEDRRAAERAQTKANRWEWLKAKSYVPFRYFAKLPATTQILMLILLLAWVLPKSLKTVLEIWKAVK